ncbi:hypothetical protein AHAS_Ahas16G0244700 [Arachis hypogaea]
MLYNVLDDARAKLVDYHGRMRNNIVPTAHNSIDNCVESTANQDSEASAQQIAMQGLGGFMSLLNSFDNT